jgi:hypothetical protein
MPLSRVEQECWTPSRMVYRSTTWCAAKLNFMAAKRHIRHQTVIAHGCLWLGMSMALTGSGLVHVVLAAGVLLILNGFGLLVMATVAVVQLRSPVGSRRRRSF